MLFKLHRIEIKSFYLVQTWKLVPSPVILAIFKILNDEFLISHVYMNKFML